MQEHPLLCTQRSKLKAAQWPGISLRQANGPTAQILSDVGSLAVRFTSRIRVLPTDRSATLLHGRAKLWARAFPVHPREVPGMQRAEFLG